MYFYYIPKMFAPAPKEVSSLYNPINFQSSISGEDALTAAEAKNLFASKNGNNIFSAIQSFSSPVALNGGILVDGSPISNTNILKLNELPVEGDLESDTVPLVLMLGQSNTDGRGVSLNMPHFAQFPWQPIVKEARGGFTINSSNSIVAYNASLVGAVAQFPPVSLEKNVPVRIYNKILTRNPGNTTTNNVVNGAWEDYTGLNNVVVSPQATGTAGIGCGSEIQLAYNWATNIFPNYKKQLHIIKCAVGGTSLASGGSIQNDWSSNANQLWFTFLNFVYKPAILDILRSGKKPQLLGIYWGQGESDSNSANSQAYETNLRSLITNRFRQQLGFPDAKVFLMGLSGYATDVNWESVKAAQIAVAEGNNKLENVILIRTDGSNGTQVINRYDAGVAAGDIHFNTTGLIDLGDQLFKLLGYYKGSDYKGCYDFEMVSASMNIDDPIFKSKMYKHPFTTDLVSIKNLLHETGVFQRSLTWFRDPSTPARPTFGGSGITPYLRIIPLDNAADQEIIVSYSIQNDAQNKSGIILRGSHSTLTAFNSGNWTSGILIQFRSFLTTGQITCFSFSSSGSPVSVGTAGDLGISNYIHGETINFKITFISNKLRVFSSRTLLTADWVECCSYTDFSFPVSGNTYVNLFNGLPQTNAPYNYLCSFDNIIATKL